MAAASSEHASTIPFFSLADALPSGIPQQAASSLLTRPRPAFTNPYAGHRALSTQEQELLGEYARLAATIKRINVLSATISSSSAHSALLSQLRVLERKMGLVLTLFKASVWAIVVEQQDEAEARELEMKREEAEAAWRMSGQQGSGAHDGYQDEGDETLRAAGQEAYY